MKPKFNRLLAASITTVLALSSSANAATFYWDDAIGSINTASDGGTGAWTVGVGGWESGGAAVNWANGNDAVFGGTAGTLTLGGAITATSLTFGAVDGYLVTGNTLTVGAGGITANGNTEIASALVLSATPETWAVANGKTLTLSSNTRMSVNGARTLNFGSAGGTLSFTGTGGFSVGDATAGTFGHTNGTVEITTTSEGFGSGLRTCKTISYRISLEMLNDFAMLSACRANK